MGKDSSRIYRMGGVPLKSRRPFMVRSIVATARLRERDLLPQFRQVASHGKGNWRVIRTEVSPGWVGANPRGHLSVRGMRSLAEARRALAQAARAVSGKRSIGLLGFRVDNIVATSEVGHYVDLAKLSASGCPHETDYEPELFPALIMRFTGSRCIALVFGSGKFVITGAKSLAEIRETISEVLRCVSQT